MASNKEMLAKILANSEKKYGTPVAPMSEIAVPTKWISTGNMNIDYVTGGGVPLGRSLELSGLPSSGKSTTALQAAVTLQRIILSGGDPELGVSADDKILYLDYEQAMDPEYAKKLGLDVDDPSFLFSQPVSLENGANLILDLCGTGLIRMVIIDSVAAMTPDQKIEKEVGEYHVGVKARLLTDFMEKMNAVAAENNVSVILLNHTKEKMGMGARPGAPPIRTTPGGVGLKYYASVRLEYEPRKQHKASVYDPVLAEKVDQVIANDVLVKTVKNKLAPPYRKQIVRVRYGRGFDNFFSAVTILMAHKKIMYSAGIYYFHKLETEGGAPDWMTRAATGTHRPYIKGEPNLYSAAEKDPTWAELLETIAETLIYEDPEAAPEEEPEPEDENESLGVLTGPGHKVTL